MAAIHLDYDLTIDQLPQECIEDCTTPGQDASEPVSYWRKRLEFTVNPDRARECLQGYGAWEPDELAAMDDDELAGKVLWLACCDFREFQHDAGRGHSGSDIFVLE